VPGGPTKTGKMRHSGHVFRRWAARCAPVLLLPALLASAVQAAEPPEVTGVRLGRHAGFLRLVFDLTAPPDYGARATQARVFEVSLPGASLPPEGHRALAADPLAPDLIVRPAPGGGPLRFRVTSRHDAFIRRAFVLGPPAGGAAAGALPWRLILDIVPRPGHRAAPGTGAGEVAALPPPHGIEGTREPPAPAPAPTAAAHVEVSWARASRILRELREHRDPAADAPVPPQLVLPPRHRRPAVPLR